jgi:transcriptional regulator with XRE-family HTH domain
VWEKFVDLTESRPASLVADRLRRVRENRGLTQRELARLCGIGENQINKYENGGSDPSLANLKVIAQVLEVSADYLLGLSDHPIGSLNEKLKPDEHQLLAAYVSGDSATIMELVSSRLRQLSKSISNE